MKKNKIICSSGKETYQMVYWEWGDLNNDHILICVHGLTRNGRDFDYIAKALENDYRIICPDLVGRGQSDWLTQAENYHNLNYLQDILTLLQELKLKKVDWLGTSMGGIIGMLMAANYPSVIERLILNDLGTVIPKSALQRIVKYLLIADRLLPNFNAVEQHIRRNYGGFGQLTDEQWYHLAKHSVTLLPDGQYRLNYDPKIAYPFQNKKITDLQDVCFWDIWKKLTCPVLLLHGKESDLLLLETIEQMKIQKSNLEVIHFEKVGHAPALMDRTQIETVKQWLSNVKPETIYLT